MTCKYWKIISSLALMTALTWSWVNTTSSRFQTNLEVGTAARAAAFQLEMLSPDGAAPASRLYLDADQTSLDYPFLVKNNSEVSVRCSLSCPLDNYAVQFSPSGFTLAPGETQAVTAVISPTTDPPATEQTEIVLSATQAD